MGSDSNKTNVSGGDGTSSGGVLQIPPTANKVVQNLKEIVNNKCTDSEIYAVLRDCIWTLTTPFNASSLKVKETQELKTRDGGDYWQIGAYLGKAAYKKENGPVAAYIPYSASLKLGPTGQTWNEQTSPQSNSFNADDRRHSIGTGDMIDSSMRPSYGSQSSWVGVPQKMLLWMIL